MSEVRDRYVYIYEDIGGTPFYVGVGKGNRMHDHVRRAKTILRQSPHSAKAQYVMDCIERGFPPDPYKIAKDLTIAEAMEIERSLIKQIGRLDLGTGPLLNACDGGKGIKNFSEETRALIAARTKEAMAANEIRVRISDAGRQRFATPEARAEYSEKTKRQWASEDGRAKFAAKAKTRWTPELRTVGNNQLGKKRSAESRAKMSASAKKFWNVEARAKQADRMRGKKLSDETRAKMRASQQARFSSEVRAEA